MYKKIVLGLFAVAAFFPLPYLAGEVHAQNHSVVAAPRINGFDVQAVRKPEPGSELLFTLYGSPGGSAAVQISGATGGATLSETETGVYEGSYTIRSRDKITADSTATANLRVGNQVASTLLDEPLIGTPSGRRSSRAAAAAGAPKIDYFGIEPPQTLRAGEELTLIMSGSRNGKASARIAGVKGKIVLEEVRSGIYEGSHTIKRRDQIEANSVVTGNLRLGDRETNAVLGQSLVAGPGYQPRPRRDGPLLRRLRRGRGNQRDRGQGRRQLSRKNRRWSGRCPARQPGGQRHGENRRHCRRGGGWRLRRQRSREAGEHHPSTTKSSCAWKTAAPRQSPIRHNRLSRWVPRSR